MKRSTPILALAFALAALSAPANADDGRTIEYTIDAVPPGTPPAKPLRVIPTTGSFSNSRRTAEELLVQSANGSTIPLWSGGVSDNGHTYD